MAGPRGGAGLATPDLDDVKESVRQGVTKVAGRLSNLASGALNQLQVKTASFSTIYLNLLTKAHTTNRHECLLPTTTAAAANFLTKVNNVCNDEFGFFITMFFGTIIKKGLVFSLVTTLVGRRTG